MNHELKELILQLNDLLSANLSINEAVKLLQHCRKDELNRHLQSGKNFSQYLSNQGLTKSQAILLTNLERVGLTAQALELIMENELEYSKLKKDLISILAYPFFVICCCFLALLFFEYFLLPMFDSVFGSLNIKPPAIITVLKMIKFLPLIFGGIFLLLKIFKIDLLKNFGQEIENIQILKQVQSALANNYPLTEVFKQIKPLQYLIFYLNKGVLLSSVLEKAKLLDKNELIKLQIAEKGSNLNQQLKIIIEKKKIKYFENLKKSVMVIEPVVIVLTGIVVGLICLTILAPLLEISGSIGF